MTKSASRAAQNNMLFRVHDPIANPLTFGSISGYQTFVRIDPATDRQLKICELFSVKLCYPVDHAFVMFRDGSSGIHPIPKDQPVRLVTLDVTIDHTRPAAGPENACGEQQEIWK